MDSDAQLVSRFRKGDQQAFAALMARYRGPIFAFILGRIGDRHLAEDLAQEAFVRCLSQLDRLRKPGAVAGWLFRIAGNLCLDAYRQRRDEIPLVSEHQVGARQMASDEYLTREQNVIVAQNVGMLPERQRVVVLLRHQVGLSCREIATVLGSPVGSVTKWLSRAYDNLKQQVGEVV